MFPLIIRILCLIILIPFGSTKSSLTLVVDTTVSMEKEIEVLKHQIGRVLTMIRKSEDSRFDNYILVPFNDSASLHSFVTTSQEEIMTKIEELSVSGGNDCPENSIAGIQKGLEDSQMESLVFVFTDAYANDFSELNIIQNLCERRRSQVFIFLSGMCVPSQNNKVGDIEVYHRIASVCSGLVFHFDSRTLKKGFNYMETMTSSDWKYIKTESFIGQKQIVIPGSDLLVGASGDSVSLNIRYEGRQHAVEKVVHTKHVVIAKVNSINTEYITIDVGAVGKGSVIIQSKRQFPFEVGFAIKNPRNMKETSKRPLPDKRSHILINCKNHPYTKVEYLDILFFDGTQKRFRLSEIYTDMYITDEYLFASKAAFRIKVYGTGSATEEVVETSSVIETQTTGEITESTGPTLELLDEDVVVDYGDNVTVACRVTAYPGADIWWEGASTVENVPLEIPSVFLSYATLHNVSSNGTYYCCARDKIGSQKSGLNVYVRRNTFFNEIRTPEDTKVEYGKMHTLYCEIHAFPEISTKWLHNDTTLYFETQSKLVITHMNLENVGTYTCEVSNSIETRRYSANITISGIEEPNTEPSTYQDVFLKPNEVTKLECRITKGKPRPEMVWRFMAENSNEFSDVPYDVYVDNGKIEFSGRKSEYKGIYRCEASNIMGIAYHDFTVKAQYAPKIEMSSDSITVLEGHRVEMPCRVDADPAAAVRWEFTQDGVPVTLDERHSTDQEHTHRFNALWKDSGDYKCIAENEVGMLAKTINVIVLVVPYIEAPENKTISVKAGDSVTLSCTVLYGFPKPTLVWEFEARGGLRRNIAEETSQLILENVSKKNEGTYTCIANNKNGSDRIKINVSVL